MKTSLKYLLQRLFGFEKYLFIFSIFKIYTLKWDKNENHFFHFLSLMPSEGALLDIGANIGIMTATAARKFRHLEIHAFEPVTSNIRTLKRIINYFKLNNVIVHEVALGNENGSIKMVMPVQNKVKFQGLSHVVHESITENNEGEFYNVPIYKLDDYAQLNNIGKKVVGIKMDVENFESFVVKGGLEMIKKHQPILYIELWDNENRSSCFNDLANIGYSPYTVVENSLRLFDRNKHQNHNFFFLPKK
ncbi:MAG TPA: FkbM family methyltransferase [Bacteroidia bacterium]|nr:FkbM family methyltransferase [Bacteroidia bacterium]